VQVIKVDHVIVDVLCAGDQVAQEAGVVRHLDAQGMLDGPDGCDGVDGRADAAKTLRKHPRLARVAPFEDGLDAAPHCAGRPGVGHFAAIHLHLDAQVTLDARDRINYDFCHCFSPSTQ